MTYFSTKLYPLSNFDSLHLHQYSSYEQTSKHRCTSFRPEKGFWTSTGCLWYSSNDPQGTSSQMYSTGRFLTSIDPPKLRELISLTVSRKKSQPYVIFINSTLKVDTYLYNKNDYRYHFYANINFKVSFDNQLNYVLHRDKASKHNNHDIRSEMRSFNALCALNSYSNSYFILSKALLY
jgi:hypothetical protein